MDENRRRRRRRGARGGQSQQRPPQGEQRRPPGPDGPTEQAPPGPARSEQRAAGAQRPERQSGRRQDTRRGQNRDDANGRPSTPEAARSSRESRIRRAPGSDRPRRDGDRPGRDIRPRVFEEPVPQDEHSVELGARFKESQIALRDARKTLEKRKAEHGDEPQWLLDQYTEAERQFADVATEWHEHLSQTGRKVIRR